MSVPNTKRSILITGSHREDSESLARSLKSLSNLSEAGIEVFTLDVTSRESIAALKEQISQLTNGKLDVLYNNAGVLFEAPAIEADSARVRQMFDTNVFGLFDVVQAFSPLLIAAVPESKSAPTIVNVASVLARLPMPFASGYNATKAAVAAYSDTLRLELEPLGVKVSTLFMGEVSTSLMLADNVRFGEHSLYIDVEHKAKERSTKHAKDSVTPTTFAKQVADQLLSTKEPSYIWKGTNAFVVWLLNAVGPRKVFDSTMKKAVGLDDASLTKKIYNRGQQAQLKL